MRQSFVVLVGFAGVLMILRMKKERLGDPRVPLWLGGLGLVAGGILLLVLLLARRKWSRQFAEARAYYQERNSLTE